MKIFMCVIHVMCLEDDLACVYNILRQIYFCVKIIEEVHLRSPIQISRNVRVVFKILHLSRNHLSFHVKKKISNNNSNNNY